jgi:hypothetical protein
MTSPGSRSLVRRLWPQRLRTRLAVFYSLLLVAAGLGVVALAYSIAINLFVPTTGPTLQRLTPSEQAILRLCKPEPSSKEADSAVPAPDRTRQPQPEWRCPGCAEDRCGHCRHPRGGRCHRPRLGGCGKGTATCAIDSRGGAAGVGAAPRSAPGAVRARGRAQTARRHLRPDVGAARRRLHEPTAFHRQRCT